MELIKSVSIENMINQRNGVVEKINHILDLACEVKNMADHAHIGFPKIMIERVNKSHIRNIDISGINSKERENMSEEIINTVDKGAWEYLMKESGLRSFMDSKARQDWDNQIKEGYLKVPEFNFDNIKATFTTLHEARGEMFERGVIECFKNLSWDYKTNQPCKFGKRIIMYYLFNEKSRNGFCSQYPKYENANKVDDILRAFHIFDGKPELDHRNSFQQMVTKAREFDTDVTEIENEYVIIKWFNNGNGHINFKRLDLVDKMNAIIAKYYPNALPPKI
ncbi:DUF4942 domain-containing protein [Xylella fastidiosa]|nr:DUF4942 domain-containing protein [Xylella fastidiosa]ALQ96031.1 hypothetical protein XFUD_12445 [Xylella fastidiosa]ALR03267.1 hypothetical protein OY18_13350 [Xylella fastidiosa]KXB10312.1 hypothetical protein ADT29_00070 [Xylella fastidiosa]KXB17492.1 hypothetical protein ADT30_00375 [Xylella fastidiosa]KXB18617.1 hypothetical protein ADT28_00070 [Xylella fastidiosa]